MAEKRKHSWTSQASKLVTAHRATCFFDKSKKTFRTKRSLETVGFSESPLSLGFSQATKYEMLFEQSEFIE